MEDKKKANIKKTTPGKPPKEITSGLRKTPAIMNLGGQHASKKGRV